MLRTSSRHVRQFGLPITALLLLLLASVSAHAQSLGDVARETREKKAEADATAPRKVITDGDLPKDAQDGDEPDAPNTRKTASPGKAGADRVSRTSAPDPRVAEQWRKQILAQKRVVATLEKRLARYQ